MNQLKQDADRLTPAFSEALHERVMARVNRARRERAAAAPEQRGWKATGIVLAGATAAAIAMGVWASLGNNEAPAQFEPVVASLKETVQPIRDQVHEPIDRATRQFEDLESDARSLAQFVADQLDLLPADGKSVEPGA